MSPPDLSAGPVVAGIDGSKRALLAALWAAPEAMERNSPLRLVYAIEPPVTPSVGIQSPATALASAEIAVREAIVAVQSEELPVKIEVEIRQRSALSALQEQSRTATLVCVGAVGNYLATGGRLGSVVEGLARTGHCPVAIIRGNEPHGTVLVEATDSSDDAVLELAIHHALLRRAPLEIVCSQTNVAQRQGDHATVRRSRLDYWLRKYPQLQATTISMERSLIKYVTQHAAQIQLVVASRRRRDGLDELIDASANAALHGTNCSLLICQEQSSL
jgi:nucleotide-binding universal stress UspA family protein